MPHRALVWTCRHNEAAGANGRGREADGLAQDDARRERSSAVCFLRLRAGANVHPATDGGAITGFARGRKLRSHDDPVAPSSFVAIGGSPRRP